MAYRMEQEAPSQPQLLRNPRQWLRWWATRKPPDNRDTAFQTVLFGIVTVALFAIGGALVAALKGDVQIALWGVVALAAGSLVMGLILGATMIRAFYEPQLRAAETGAEAAQESVEAARAEAAAERELRERLQPDSEALQRLGVYFDHVFRVLDDLSTDLTPFLEIGSEAVRNAFCDGPRELIAGAAGSEMLFSLWLEGDPDQRREKVPIEAFKERIRTFWVACAPDLTDRQVKDFSVAVNKAWLTYAREQQEGDTSGSERLFKIDDLDLVPIQGRDLEAFRTHGFASVRAAAFSFDGRRGYLVALSRTPRPVSQVEDRFIVALAAAVSLGSMLGEARGLLSAEG
jgi:hypothetical protein